MTMLGTPLAPHASLLLNLAAAALFFYRDAPGGWYAEEGAAFYVFIIASIALTYGASQTRSATIRRSQEGIWLFLFLMLTYQFGAHLETRKIVLAGFIILLAFNESRPLNLALSLFAVFLTAAVFLVANDTAGSAPTDTITGAALFVLELGSAAIVLCALSGRVASVRGAERENANLRNIMQKLAAAQLGYLEFARNAEERSSANERNRLSAELHDTIGYTFTNLEMILEAGMDLLEGDRDKLRDLLETGLGQVRDAMKETRKTLYLLRERRDAPLLFNAVQRLADVFGKTTGMMVRVEYGNFPARCGEEAEFAFYHFIQEGLVNAFSHGRATQVNISFSVEGDNLCVSILDDGIGAGTVTEGIGILGMRERFGKLGGTLHLESPVDGFRITAAVPLNG